MIDKTASLLFGEEFIDETIGFINDLKLIVIDLLNEITSTISEEKDSC